MKTLFPILLLAALTFFNAAWANSIWKWRAGQAMTSPKGEKVRIYQRFYQDEKHVFPLGQLSHVQATKVKSQSFKQFAQEVKASVKQLYRPNGMIERRYGDAFVFEGFWQKGNRFFR